MKASQNDNVIKYHRKNHFHFITIVFCVILIYLITQVVLYFTKSKIEVYEIEAPITYSLNPTYTGIITRNEINYYMDQAGFVNYYIYEGKKAKLGATVLTVDETGEFSTLLKNQYPDGLTIDQSSLASIKNSLTQSSLSYDTDRFDNFYEDKYYVNSSVLETLNVALLENMDKTSLSGLKEMASPVSGFILYQKDNFDNFTPKDITMDLFHSDRLKKEGYDSNEKRKKGDFAYKCVTDDSFQITFPISEEDESVYGEDSYIHIYLDDLGVNVNGSFALTTSSDGQRMGVISLSKYGSSYLDERYIDFSIHNKNITGLKIPVCSVVTKEFLTVPTDYVTAKEGSSAKQVMKQSGEAVTVTLAGTQDSSYLVESDSLTDGDVIVNPATGSLYTVGEKLPLTGVYNINQGYVIFKRADVLGTTSDKKYYIIDTEVSGSIKAYDHIVYDAASTAEGEIVF